MTASQTIPRTGMADSADVHSLEPLTPADNLSTPSPTEDYHTRPNTDEWQKEDQDVPVSYVTITAIPQGMKNNRGEALVHWFVCSNPCPRIICLLALSPIQVGRAGIYLV